MSRLAASFFAVVTSDCELTPNPWFTLPSASWNVKEIGHFVEDSGDVAVLNGHRSSLDGRYPYHFIRTAAERQTGTSVSVRATSRLKGGTARGPPPSERSMPRSLLIPQILTGRSGAGG